MARQISEQLLAAQQLWIERAAQMRDARFDDFLFMVQAGSTAEEAARRLGTNARALQRQAYRWHRKDIVAYLSSAAYRQRHGL